MDINSEIGDILTHYWLVENQYCGLAESMILERLKQDHNDLLTIDKIHSRLLLMQARGEVVIGRPETDPIVFPRRALLEPRDPVKESGVGIYTKQLRLGGFQTEFRYFDRKVLDRYCQDPRYEFKEYDVCGGITTHDDAQGMPPSDRVRRLRFSTAYCPSGTPVVAVILFDLGELSKAHQHYWTSYEIHQECQPDPDFIEQNFNAKPIQRISPFTALLAEIQEVNNICNLMGEPNLFRSTYKPYALPKLGWITKPTANDFLFFAHELDKLLSDNINKQFFKGKVTLKDTKGHEKGTVNLLREYLQSPALGVPSPNVLQVCEPLRKVRKGRQTPAHKIYANKFDTNYLEQQRKLVKEVLNAIHLLRMVLAKYANPKGYVPPKWLDEWRIE